MSGWSRRRPGDPRLLEGRRTPGRPRRAPLAGRPGPHRRSGGGRLARGGGLLGRRHGRARRPGRGLLPDLAVLDGPGLLGRRPAPPRAGLLRAHGDLADGRVVPVVGARRSRRLARRVGLRPPRPAARHPGAAAGRLARHRQPGPPGPRRRGGAGLGRLAAAAARHRRRALQRRVPEHPRARAAPGPASTWPSPSSGGTSRSSSPPRSRADGALVLDSGPGRFGDAGAYVLVLDDDGAHHAARVPVHERFVVFVDEEGVLRTDHDLRVGPLRSLRLHYRMTRG